MNTTIVDWIKEGDVKAKKLEQLRIRKGQPKRSADRRSDMEEIDQLIEKIRARALRFGRPKPDDMVYAVDLDTPEFLLWETVLTYMRLLKQRARLKRPRLMRECGACGASHREGTPCK